MWRLTTISQAAIIDPVKSSPTTATLNPGRSDARPRRRRRLRPAETIRRSPDNRPERGGRRPVAAPATVYSTANVHVLGRGCLRGHDKTYCRAGKHTYIVGSRCVAFARHPTPQLRNLTDLVASCMDGLSAAVCVRPTENIRRRSAKAARGQNCFNAKRRLVRAPYVFINTSLTYNWRFAIISEALPANITTARVRTNIIHSHTHTHARVNTVLPFQRPTIST